MELTDSIERPDERSPWQRVKQGGLYTVAGLFLLHEAFLPTISGFIAEAQLLYTFPVGEYSIDVNGDGNIDRVQRSLRPSIPLGTHDFKWRHVHDEVHYGIHVNGRDLFVSEEMYHLLRERGHF